VALRLELDYFELAIEVLKESRLARFYGPKAELLSVAVQLHELNQRETTPDPKGNPIPSQTLSRRYRIRANPRLDLAPNATSLS